ncbi:ectonucleotide pyrophosphatase/phosphodiesterase family member 3 [Pyrus ussuriensis x Pyrus communis]|uniref:Ectonucleotide pyrophosphatase/phosphodiesterase family member 3 n=1 Tax=Pyrus ussuriensis x Pyrus communis TaxID=2448454 RepID=A0A5N5H4L5_9ROSA|nr:ectonucleotide pyrophosphatase/phosphodiesterase family member 3 [Pyrus ussuriensis x Pyrus communis]
MGSNLPPMKSTPIPAHDEDLLDQSAALLSFNTDSSASLISSSSPSYKPNTTVIFISLILTTYVAFFAVAAFAFLFFSNSPKSAPVYDSSSAKSKARPLRKLNHPVVLLVSSDEFQFGYQFKAPIPNIRRLITNGTEAKEGLIQVFPTLMAHLVL